MGGRYAVRDLVQTLDPEQDHWRIYRLTAQVEFPWDITRALELAPYRTFTVPSVAAVLDGTGEFPLRAQKRYDDTSLRARAAVERRLPPRRRPASTRESSLVRSYPDGYEIADLGRS
jgi:hypothetical protein